MLCHLVLLAATCYGLAVSATPATSITTTTTQLRAANVSPQMSGLVRELRHNEGKFPIVDPKKGALQPDFCQIRREQGEARN